MTSEEKNNNTKKPVKLSSNRLNCCGPAKCGPWGIRTPVSLS